MKTIFFTIAILFSFTNISAQDVANQETNNTTTIKIEASKTDFYKALVKMNNFDIEIKEDKKEVANTTKNDFYNLLLEKNGFNTNTRKNARLTSNTINTNTTIKTTNDQIVSLVP